MFHRSLMITLYIFKFFQWATTNTVMTKPAQATAAITMGTVPRTMMTIITPHTIPNVITTMRMDPVAEPLPALSSAALFSLWSWLPVFAIIRKRRSLNRTCRPTPTMGEMEDNKQSLLITNHLRLGNSLTMDNLMGSQHTGSSRTCNRHTGNQLMEGTGSPRWHSHICRGDTHSSKALLSFSSDIVGIILIKLMCL